MRDIEEQREQRELRALREYDAGVPPLDAAARTRVRARLLAAMEAADAPAPAVRPRRPVLRIALACTVAAAVAGGVVVAGHDGGHRRTAAPPAATSPLMRNVSAETVLHGAAVYARQHDRVPRPRNDQFIYRKTITRSTDQKTGAATTVTEEEWRSVDGTKPSKTQRDGMVPVYWSASPSTNIWPPAEWATLQKFPTDPEKLILYLAGSKHGKLRKLSDITYQWGLLRFKLTELLEKVPAMPEGLRPALFEALGMVPGVKVVPNQTDAAGRPGVAVTYDNPAHPDGGQSSGDYLVFDAKTYEFLGFHDTVTTGSGKHKTVLSQFAYIDDWTILDSSEQRP